MGLLERVSKLVRSDSSGVSPSSSQTTDEKKSLLKKSESFRNKPGFFQKALGMRKQSENESSSQEIRSDSEEPLYTAQDLSDHVEPSSLADFELDPSDSHSEEFSLPELDHSTEDFSDEEDSESIEFPESGFENSSSEVSSDSDPFEIKDEFSAPEGFENPFESSDHSAEENEDDISIDDLFGEEETPSPEISISDSDTEENFEPEPEVSDDTKDESSPFDEPLLDDDPLSSDEDPFGEWVKEAEQEAQRTPPKKDTNAVPSEKAEFLFDDDSNFTTSPIDLQIASRKKLDNYISVFEISKEIGVSTDFANFFENLLFSIMGQIGSESIGIFSSKNGSRDFFRLEDFQGEGFDQEWTVSSEDEIYHAVSNAGSVVYAKELIKPILPAKEKEILQKSGAELLVPIRYMDDFFGIIVLSKTIGGEDYSVEDLEFLKIIGEIAGSVYKRIYDTEQLHQENQNLKEVIRTNELIISLARDFAAIRTMDEAYDRLFAAFRDELKMRRATFMILDGHTKNEFRVFASNLLTPEHVGNFSLSLDSSIVGIVSNIPGVFRIENFRKHPELMRKLSNDELGMMGDFIVIPFINLHWLVGMLIVHETEIPWTDTDRETAVGISEVLAPVFSNLLLVQERDSVFKDPFSPVEEKIEEMILKSARLASSFSLTIFKIQNISRMVKLKGSGFFAAYSEELRKSIQENLSEADFHYRIGQGKFAVVLDGKDREETQVLIRKIKNRLGETDRKSKDFQTSVIQHTLCYPADTREKERILELLEES
ncbi:GAF domain-containing protein [Leptospira gomenensis]|uniref:GAF domain-containing protein n=1 Tax=Leptospira gomenensis TaxID=2484974 RepID=A0A5F1Z1E5_9LEPT|nr:GAF domain-containing protein [Leptospira gomenensis]TGK29061.1 GAF domain-containing protein [Leptospira gomenensis]TGK45028.1 GAF domain-containing protein [Leptospira gomenensis]TGK51836.1 GAF domain-containing protein [Leptospira gomenensis]TGK67355.1 GAF domain-containing protein [Leptospira gomenensis]